MEGGQTQETSTLKKRTAEDTPATTAVAAEVVAVLTIEEATARAVAEVENGAITADLGEFS